MKEAAPDLSCLTMDLLFNPATNSLHTRIEALSASDFAQGGFEICNYLQFVYFVAAFFKGLTKEALVSPFDSPCDILDWGLSTFARF